jgi:hypothetical protein
VACAPDETQKRRPADLRLRDRREDATALVIGRAPAQTSFTAPTSISSALATAPLCADLETVPGSVAGAEARAASETRWPR